MKESPAKECRDGTGILKTVPKRKHIVPRHMGEFSDASYAAENFSPIWALQCRDGTGILKTVSKRRCPEGFSDAYAAE